VGGSPWAQHTAGDRPAAQAPVIWPSLEEACPEPWPPEHQVGFLAHINLPLPVIIGATVIGLILLVYLAVRLFGGDADKDGIKPTPDATALSEYVVPTSDALVTDGGTPQLESPVPIFITMKGLQYEVLPYPIQQDGTWRYPAGQSGTAVWVYGTIINYAIGVEQTRANLAVLESLAPGDQITITMSNSAVYRFGFVGRGQLASAGINLFDQTRPGLTLVSLGGDLETRVVVYGEFLGVAEQYQSGQPGIVSFSVGEPAPLGETRVTVLGTSYLYDDPRVPDGWAFYLLDFQIENLSQEVLDPNRFRMELQDGVGTSYSLNLPASQAGTFGFLALTIPPNTVAQGTAGYLVPAPLMGPRLSWSFSRLDLPDRIIKVMIDFASPSEVIDPRQMAEITLLGAELSGDGTLLSVWGTVLNGSQEELAVMIDEVVLQCGGAALALRAADPAFPWQVEPGGVLGFRVTFQRPPLPTATLIVLGRSFEISGMD